MKPVRAAMRRQREDSAYFITLSSVMRNLIRAVFGVRGCVVEAIMKIRLRFAVFAVISCLVAAPSSAAGLPLCSAGKRVTCVVDGDTFWLDGTKIRLAGIDAPERTTPHCESERILAERATLRLQSLLNEGRFDLASTGRDEDKYGRKLRLVMRGSRSIGDVLISEGLAREWDGARRSWCD